MPPPERNLTSLVSPAPCTNHTSRPVDPSSWIQPPHTSTRHFIPENGTTMSTDEINNLILSIRWECHQAITLLLLKMQEDFTQNVREVETAMIHMFMLRVIVRKQ